MSKVQRPSLMDGDKPKGEALKAFSPWPHGLERSKSEGLGRMSQAGFQGIVLSTQLSAQ